MNAWKIYYIQDNKTIKVMCIWQNFKYKAKKKKYVCKFIWNTRERNICSFKLNNNLVKKFLYIKLIELDLPQCNHMKCKEI